MLADVGISKTAFYKHFDSKEDLMIAALEMQNRWLQDTFRAMIRERGGPTAIGRLYARPLRSTLGHCSPKISPSHLPVPIATTYRA
jgi:AcrR family transcriptional regulator